MMLEDRIEVTDAPAIPGLSFRRFRGDSDYPPILAVIAASSQADQVERADTLDDIARNYQRLTNCDPYQDMIFAEIRGEVTGYARGWWWDDGESSRIYGIVGFLVPAWRRKGIGSAMLRWMEEHLRTVAEAQPAERAQFFEVSASQSQQGLSFLLERAGYLPVRHFYEMVRPDLEDIPDLSLPDGLEMRPVSPDHYRAIWASIDETSQDEWGYTTPTEEDHQVWLDSPRFQPRLWQIAWDPATGRVVGHVLTFIDREENEKFGRKRSYTEGIGVDRAWRRRGLARALIAHSLQAQKETGMAESAMNVDSENLSGATRLYESLGFRVIRRDAVYRKPL